MRLAKIIAFGVIGFALGLGLSQMIGFGYFIRWERLPKPPSNVSELIPHNDPPFFIKTLDGSIYHYLNFPNEGWQKASSLPIPFFSPVKVNNPCDFSSPEFSLISNAPQNIKDCIQEDTYRYPTITFPASFVSYTIAIDIDGNIWQWKRVASNDFILIILICFPLFGLLTGLWITITPTKRNGNKKT